MQKRQKRTWIFEVLVQGSEDPAVKTTYWGFEENARTRLMELHKQMEKIHGEGRTTRMYTEEEPPTPLFPHGTYAILPKRLAFPPYKAL